MSELEKASEFPEWVNEPGRLITRREFLEKTLWLGGAIAAVRLFGGTVLTESVSVSTENDSRIPIGTLEALQPTYDYYELNTPLLAEQMLEYHQKGLIVVTKDFEINNLELAKRGYEVPTEYHLQYGGRQRYVQLDPLILGHILDIADAGLKPELWNLTGGGHIKTSRHWEGKAADIAIDAAIARHIFKLYQKDNPYIINEFLIEPPPSGTQTIVRGRARPLISVTVKKNHEDHIHVSTFGRS